MICSGPRPHPVVLREIHPADSPGRIQQEFGWPGDVLSIDPSTPMQEIMRRMTSAFGCEGFVNEHVQHDSAVNGKLLVLGTDRIENIPYGWQARETYKIVNQDEYTELFELAPPQKEFAVYSGSHWSA